MYKNAKKLLGMTLGVAAVTIGTAASLHATPTASPRMAYTVTVSDTSAKPDTASKTDTTTKTDTSKKGQTK